MDETYYIISGEGSFLWDDKEIPFRAGDVLSYPAGGLRRTVNTGKMFVLYICVSTLQ